MALEIIFGYAVIAAVAGAIVTGVIGVGYALYALIRLSIVLISRRK